jgi:hypothetical protein
MFPCVHDCSKQRLWTPFVIITFVAAAAGARVVIAFVAAAAGGCLVIAFVATATVN